MQLFQQTQQTLSLQLLFNMTLGGLDKRKIGAVSDTDFDFSALSNRVQSIEQKQNYMLMGLLLLLILTLTKK